MTDEMTTEDTAPAYERVLSNGVTVHVGPEGSIGWADDWGKVVDLAYGPTDEITTKFYRYMYGHTDYYVKV